MDRLKAIDRAFEEAIQAKTFSGAQVRAGKGENNLFAAQYGRVSEAPDAAPITPRTLFDIASLTKPFAAAMLAMLSEEQGRAVLDRSVSEYLPEFRRAEVLTVRQLLAHVSGLPAWLPLFHDVVGKGWSYAEVKECYTSQIARTPLLHTPGQTRVYSDLGFILLGFVLEAIHGRRLDSIFSERISSPLGLARTVFEPRRARPEIPAFEIAATEASPANETGSWRGRSELFGQGEVHDDNAFVLGGIAGHAGLFSTAEDVETWVRALFSVWEGEEGLVHPTTLRRYVGPEVFPKLGWDTVSREESQAGRYFSQASVGHLAFTGCSLWMDLQDQKYLILFTNRVHPRRENEAIKEFRPRVHDLLVESLGLTRLGGRP